MKTKEIAEKLVAYLRSGNFQGAQEELFSKDALSVEPAFANIPDIKGLDNILVKGQQFRDRVEEWYGIIVSDAVIAKGYFSIALKVDLKFKGQEKSSLDEIIVYQVKDGKIKREEFFYTY